MTHQADPDWLIRQREARERAREPFEHLALGRLHLSHQAPAGKRLSDALWALRQWRMTHNQSQEMRDEVALGVRMTAETMADQIQAAAGPEHDPATIAWVLAGMRCPSRPWCAGCVACQTVTSPLRPAGGGR